VYMYRVIRKLNNDFTVIQIYLQYQANKTKCGRKKTELTPSETDYINEKALEGWTLDVIIGRNERPVSCGIGTLYRRFSGEFNQKDLPMKGKRKPNGHQEKRGKQSLKCSFLDQDSNHPIIRKAGTTLVCDLSKDYYVLNKSL